MIAYGIIRHLFAGFAFIHTKETRMQATETKLLTVKEVAELFGRHEDTIRRWLREGHLKGIQIGKRGKYIIPQRNIEEFLNNSEPQAETE